MTKRKPTQLAPVIQFQQALERGHSKAAIQIWDQHLKDTDNIELLAHASIAYAELKQFDAAIGVLRRACELEPGRPALWLGLATTQSQAGRASEAEATLLAALRLHAEFRPLSIQLARILRHEKRPLEALQILDAECRGDDPGTEECLLLADVYRDLQRWTDAADVYERLLVRNPNHVAALRGAANVLVEQGELVRATAILQRAVTIDPSRARTWYQLGVVERLLDRYSDATKSLARSIELDPTLEIVREYLGRTFQEWGKIQEARAVFTEWLTVSPNHSIARHMLAALDGQAPPDRADDEYVTSVFDEFADSFEAVLAKLQYRVPEIIGGALNALALPADRSLRILDAGCGTGLCGPVLRPYARTLVGVDLSPKMLEQAKRRRHFDELCQAELVAFLQHSTEPFDLIVSADTLNYFGNLAPVIAAADKALAPNGRVIFTLEQAEDDATSGQAYVLNMHGRYSHQSSYVQSQLAVRGFATIESQTVVLRTENNQPVLGRLWIASKRAFDPCGEP